MLALLCLFGDALLSALVLPHGWYLGSGWVRLLSSKGLCFLDPVKLLVW